MEEGRVTHLCLEVKVHLWFLFFFKYSERFIRWNKKKNPKRPLCEFFLVFAIFECCVGSDAYQTAGFSPGPLQWAQSRWERSLTIVLYEKVTLKDTFAHRNQG